MGRFMTGVRRVRAARVAFAAAALLASTFLAGAQERPLRGVAMVIGNSGYTQLPALANPANDARAVEMLLSALGFETELSSDRDARRLARDLDIFVEDAEGADVAILYYAGHGIEAGGENFLVPVDADASALDAAGEKLVPVSAYIERLQATVPVVIVMLDACRDNPFPPGSTVRLDGSAPALPMGEGGLGETRGATRLAPAGAPATENFGTVIAFAAEPGRAALDGDPGGNSPYTAAVLRHLETMAGEEFGTVMRMVAEEVYLKTAGRQRPWVNESLRRLLYFGAAPQPTSGAEGDILTERRQLLITISALPVQGRSLVERVAGDRGVPMDALFAMLDTLGADLPDDPAELDRLLRRLADDLKAVLEERSALRSTDPEIMRLAGLAETATSEGALATAVALYEQAKARIGELEKTVSAAEDDIRDRRIEFAEVYARSAQARALALDHLGAAGDYAEAAAQVERWDAGRSSLYRLAQARALADHGVIRGDTPALEQAVGVLDELARTADGAFGAQVQEALAGALAELGRRQTANASLERAVATYRALLEGAEEIDRAAVSRRLGGALLALGRRDIGNDRLEQALAVLEDALSLVPRDAGARQWAETQIDLGQARIELWQRDRESDALDRAIGHYRAALGEFDRETSTASWASAQLGLGQALRFAGLRAAGSLPGQYFGFFAAGSTDRTRQAGEMFAESDKAFEAAVEACDRDVYPVCWAAAQHGRAVALYSLGSVELDDREAAYGHFRRSMAAFENALGEQRFDMSPLGWAETYASRAEMLERFGLRSAAGISLIYLAEAARGYREALSVISRESLPAMWLDINNRAAGVYGEMISRDGRKGALAGHARMRIEHLRAALSAIDPHQDRETWLAQQSKIADGLMRLGDLSATPEPMEEGLALREELGLTSTATEFRRLGDVLLGLAEKNDDPKLVRASRKAFEEAWAVRLRKGDSPRPRFEWLMEDLAKVDARLAGFETARLQEAAGAFRAELTPASRIADPVRWARAQYDLGAVLHVLGERAQDAALLEEAVEAYRAALEEWTLAADPLRHGLTQEFLGDVLQRLAERGGGVPRFREQAAAYEAALAGLTRQEAPYDYARLNRKLADRLNFSIGQAEDDRESLKRAIVHYRAATEIDTIEESPGWFTGLQRAAGDVASELARLGEGAEFADAAIEAYRLSASLGPAMGDLVWRAEAQERLGYALVMRGELSGEVEGLREGAAHLEEAVALRAEQGDTVDEAYTRAGLGRTLYLIGYQAREDAPLERAAGEIGKALAVFAEAGHDESVMWANHYIGHALTELADRGGGRIDEAIAAYEAVIALRPRETHPDDWASATHNIAFLRLLAAGEDGSADAYRLALAMARSAAEVYEQAGNSYYVALGRSLACKALAGLARAEGDVTLAREAVGLCALATPPILESGDGPTREKMQKTNEQAGAVLAQLEGRKVEE